MTTKQAIAKANDLFRTTMIQTPRHRVMLTSGVAQGLNREKVISAVMAFNNFTKENDPYGEHDFGKVIVDDEAYFWKIDYYDEKYEYGGDPKEGPVSRVLTIMLANEY